MDYQVDGVPRDADWDAFTRAFARKWFSFPTHFLRFYNCCPVLFTFPILGMPCGLSDFRGALIACGEMKSIFTELQTDHGIVSRCFIYLVLNLHERESCALMFASFYLTRSGVRAFE